VNRRRIINIVGDLLGVAAIFTILAVALIATP